MTLSMGACCANVYVFSPNGSILVPQTVVGTAFFSDAVTEPLNGTYTLLVDPGNTTGSITFTLYNVPPDVSATIAEGGPSVTVSNTAPGQNMNVTFSGSSGQVISLNSSFSMNCCLTTITVVNPDGSTLVAPSSGGCCLFIDKTSLAQTGTYTIKVDPNSTAVGSATLTLYNVPPDASGTITPGGSSVTIGNSVPGQDAYLTLSGSSGQLVSINGTTNLNGGQGQATIYNPDGTTLYTSGPLGCCFYMDRTSLSQAGTYKIYMDFAGATVGTVTVTVYNVPPDATGTITIGGPAVTISNSVPGQNMQLTFSGTTGKTINLTPSFSPCGIGGLAIYNPDGTALFGPQGFPGCLWGLGPYTLPQTGTYRIYLDPAGNTIQSATETLTDPPAPSSRNQSSQANTGWPSSPVLVQGKHSSAKTGVSGPRPTVGAADQNDLVAGPEYWPPDGLDRKLDRTAQSLPGDGSSCPPCEHRQAFPRFPAKFLNSTAPR